MPAILSCNGVRFRLEVPTRRQATRRAIRVCLCMLVWKCSASSTFVPSAGVAVFRFFVNFKQTTTKLSTAVQCKAKCVCVCAVHVQKQHRRKLAQKKKSDNKGYPRRQRRSRKAGKRKHQKNTSCAKSRRKIPFIPFHHRNTGTVSSTTSWFVSLGSSRCATSPRRPAPR